MPDDGGPAFPLPELLTIRVDVPDASHVNVSNAAAGLTAGLVWNPGTVRVHSTPGQSSTPGLDLSIGLSLTSQLHGTGTPATTKPLLPSRTHHSIGNSSLWSVLPILYAREAFDVSGGWRYPDLSKGLINRQPTLPGKTCRLLLQKSIL